MPKVSVVVPVYNVDTFLHKCLDSIAEQTLRDIEIVCIDDGSTDNCPQILDEYARKDPRFIVIHKKNEGYGKAMNVGIDRAHGKYIGIVESDDYILPEMYQILYETAEAYQLDVVKSDYFLFQGNCRSLRHSRELEAYYHLVLQSGQRKTMFEFPMFNWTGIYLRSFLCGSSIRHQETPGAAYQDNGFWLQVMSQCRRAMWLNQAFYMYRQDNPAASMKRGDKIRATIEEHNFAEQILRKKGLEKELSICAFYRMRDYRVVFYRVDDSMKREYADIVAEDYRKYVHQVDPEYVTEKQELFLWLERLVGYPDEVCDQIISLKQAVWNRLNRAEAWIIYGAGTVARNVCDRLLEVADFRKIRCAAVTDEPEQAEFMGLPVKCSSDIAVNCKSDLVLICVSKKNRAYTEILERLRELAFENYIDVDDLRYI